MTPNARTQTRGNADAFPSLAARHGTTGAPLAKAATLSGSVVDVFCGAGGLSHGFMLEGFDDRAISLREAALLQTFPPGYEFFKPGERWHISAAARCIGNAVPVALARAVARSVARTLNGGRDG